jgi:hypothetical protein
LPDGALKRVARDVQQATTSWERFLVLQLAAESGSFTVTDAQKVIQRGSWATAQEHVDKLKGAGLVRSIGKTKRYRASDSGSRTYEAIVRMAREPAVASNLESCRLLAVRLTAASRIGTVKQILLEGALSLMETDGFFDFIGVYPDDHGLVRDLRTRAAGTGVEQVALIRVARVQRGGI